MSPPWLRVPVGVLTGRNGSGSVGDLLIISSKDPHRRTLYVVTFDQYRINLSTGYVPNSHES